MNFDKTHEKCSGLVSEKFLDFKGPKSQLRENTLSCYNTENDASSCIIWYL